MSLRLFNVYLNYSGLRRGHERAQGAGLPVSLNAEAAWALGKICFRHVFESEEEEKERFEGLKWYEARKSFGEHRQRHRHIYIYVHVHILYIYYINDVYVYILYYN